MIRIVRFHVLSVAEGWGECWEEGREKGEWWGDCWEQWEDEKQRNGSPPSSPLFPGTLPSTLRITFGDLGFLSPVAGGSDLNF